MAASQRILLGHIKGEKGDTGTITVGPVTVGEPGSNPQVTATGTDEDKQLNFTLPTSPTVRVGTVGATAPGNAPQVNPGGTARDLVLNFVIPQGQTGPGGGTITPLRSNAVPMIYRMPINNLLAGSHNVLGAMDLHGWYNGSEWNKTRIEYYTTNPTDGVLQGWQRTAYSPIQERYMFWTRNAVGINFATSGYRGNWCRDHSFYDNYFAPSWVGSGSDIWYGIAGRDFDGLVFTNTNRAMWIWGRGKKTSPNREAITLVGLTATAITSMWAGVTPTDNYIWVIQSNQLRRCHIQNSVSAPSYGVANVNSAIRRRINSAADMPFAQVTDAALPTTMFRVYAEGDYVVVWGTATGRVNRAMAYSTGSSWATLTAPCNVHNITNCVIIFPGGRLAVLDNGTGDYYTCDNPMAGAGATWRLRYRVQWNHMLTNGFHRGLPQFVPRGFYSFQALPVYAEFDATSHDGGTVYRNPLSAQQEFFPWPSELYCSTSRPEIIPGATGYQQQYGAYAYPYGLKTSYVSLFGDNKSALALADWSPVVSSYPTWDAQGRRTDNQIPMPPGLSPASPNTYFAAGLRRGPAAFIDEANRRVGAIYTGDPGNVAAG